jgi:polyhydroxybutyrate depolymerase
MVGNVSRTYIVHVPPGYTGTKPAPLVFDFHPLGVPAGTWKLATGWAGVADQAGFILVVAQGDGDSWNVGKRCCMQAHDDGMDDVAFVRAMAAKVSADACIDSKRIYATGCSNGGGLTYKLACDAADLIAAAAPVDFDCITGATNNPSCGDCNPSRPMSVYQFRNQQDKSVPYEGGPTEVVAGLEFPGAKANFADWANRNSCSGTAQSVPNQPMCDQYGSCAGGTEIALCTQPFGYHCANYIPFGIANTAWTMLQKNARP